MIGTSEKWRSEVTAQNLGTRLARHAGVNQSGRYYVSTIVGLSGVGGRSWGDGIDSAGIEMGQASTVHNVEWVENNFPLMYLFRRHITDGPGAGKFRGGSGEESLLMLHDAPDEKIKVVAFGVVGMRNSGHGTGGGYPGAPSILAHIENSDLNKIIANGQIPTELESLKGTKTLLDYRTFEFRSGDAMYLRCASGGGYGDPLERDSESVRNDVLNGFVSRKAAKDVYGVVFEKNGQVDVVNTERQRSVLRGDRGAKSSINSSKPVELSRDGGSTVRSPLQEYLQICSDGKTAWISCCSCGHILCDAEQDWLEACSTTVFSPTRAGPLMEILDDKFMFEQCSCPSCGVSLKVAIVEKAEAKRAR
jgi:N-methylhydantoinase B